MAAARFPKFHQHRNGAGFNHLIELSLCDGSEKTHDGLVWDSKGLRMWATCSANNR